MQHATYLPTAGRPPYWDLYSCVHPAPSLHEDSQIAGLALIDPRTTYNRAERQHIVSRALAAVGAEKVGPAEWLMVDEKGNLYTPRAILDFVVYHIPARLVRGHSNFNGP